MYYIDTDEGKRRSVNRPQHAARDRGKKRDETEGRDWERTKQEETCMHRMFDWTDSYNTQNASHFHVQCACIMNMRHIYAMMKNKMGI